MEEPGSRYIGHFAAEFGDATSIKTAIMSFLMEHNIATEYLTDLGCDGTSTNTGHNNGVIRQLEVEINRPLYWFICMLHFNELSHS